MSGYLAFTLKSNGILDRLPSDALIMSDIPVTRSLSILQKCGPLSGILGQRNPV